MKKLISVLFALMIAPSVYAEKLIITYDNNDIMHSVAVYDEAADYSIPEGGSAFIYDPFAETREQYFAKPESKYPDIYERELDAASTFAVVTKVYEEYRNETLYTAVEVLYRGKKQVIYADEDVQIASAPEMYSTLAGERLSVLQAGDIINVTAYFSGEVKDVNLIARFGNEDIITSATDYGVNFEKLYGRGGFVKWGGALHPICDYAGGSSSDTEYKFGVIYYADSEYFLLTNKAGRAEEFEEVEFLPNSIVYTCDMGGRLVPEIADTFVIRESFIMPGDIDDDENINAWSTEGDYVYALARTVDGIATDIVLLYNFK